MKVQATLVFDLEDEDSAMIGDRREYLLAAEAAEDAIRHRLMGQGFLSGDILIGTWAVDTRIIDGEMDDPDPAALSDEYGGIWAEHPEFPVDSWVQEVIDGYTRAGYWPWVAGKKT